MSTSERHVIVANNYKIVLNHAEGQLLSEQADDLVRSGRSGAHNKLQQFRILVLCPTRGKKNHTILL